MVKNMVILMLNVDLFHVTENRPFTSEKSSNNRPIMQFFKISFFVIFLSYVQNDKSSKRLIPISKYINNI